MSGVTKKLISASGGVAGGPVMIEDVFSTYLYTGNSSTQTITNGIDLAGEGGLVWAKSRGQTYNHHLMDTENGATNFLKSNSTDFIRSSANVISSFNSDGFTIGGGSQINESTDRLASWSFRKAPRFFDVVTYTGEPTTSKTISHNLGSVPGMIIVKRTNAVGNWAVYHRSTGETKFLELEDTIAATTNSTYWFNTAPTDTQFTVGSDSAVNNDGATYVAYLFAHDPLGPSGDGSDGLIDCGSFTEGAGNVEVDLGWEPQFVLMKSSSVTGFWYLYDNMRGIATGGNDARLFPNESFAENSGSDLLDLTSTGFIHKPAYGSGEEVIYIAIRRGPMRAPTSGTEVFEPRIKTGTSALQSYTLGFQPDAYWGLFRESGLASFSGIQDRLRGGKVLRNNQTFDEEFTSVRLGTPVQNRVDFVDLYYNNNGATMVDYFFRRAPEFFDAVAYSGDGTINRVINHNLKAVPELAILKNRSINVSQWLVHHPLAGAPNNGMQLQSTNGNTGSGIYSAAPTETTITLGNSTGTDFGQNRSGDGYIWYGFATLAGISKVGSYTGNGTSQTINCGFTTGARFILIKRTDAAGDWYVWDTARGIIAGNDPFLELNTTAAEVTTDDSIDPASSGFIVNQTAVTDVNVNAASYIFYAVA